MRDKCGVLPHPHACRSSFPPVPLAHSAVDLGSDDENDGNHLLVCEGTRGLTKQQVLQCFDFLTKLDNPDMEYNQWVEIGEGVPTSLRQVNGINTNDETQVDEHLVPLFSRNTKVMDFYLPQVVFPRAAKEFPSKLSTSA